MSSVYWDRLEIDGAEIELGHLDPFVHACTVPDAQIGSLRINVRFSNHCFTEEFDEAKHAANHKVMDRNRPRAFDRIRYDLSTELPRMVRELPTRKVHQTPERRNYMYFSAIAELAGHEYRMFFHLKKAEKSAGHHLELFVESAYPVPVAAQGQKRPNAIRFPILALKVYRGETVWFPRR